MRGKERTVRFLQNEPVDRLPFHPLVMQFAAKQAGVPYSEYCLEPERHADAMIHCAEHLGLDYVPTGGYPYCEAIAYGLDVEFPGDNLPLARSHAIEEPTASAGIVRELDIEAHELMMRRVDLVAEYKRRADEDLFICGWFEGPMAEYADLRGMTGAYLDLMDFPAEVEAAMATLTSNAKKWASLQVQAGADCIGIGDAACSQIGPALYDERILEFHKQLVDHIHALGAYAKIHICGDITSIMGYLIDAGFNIIDVDHLVKDMAPFVDLLGPGQVLLGNLDPVSVVQDGDPDRILQETLRSAAECRGRGIVAAGCEIPRDTPVENYVAFFDAAAAASRAEYGVKLL